MENSKIKRTIDMCIGIVFIAVIIFFCVMNRNILRASIAGRIHTVNLDNARTEFDGIEAEYKNGFYGKAEFIDIYGITQKLLSRQILSDFGMIYDDYGMMHNVNLRNTAVVTEQFIPETCSLSEIAEQKDSDFLYIQGPNREVLRDCGLIKEFNNENEISDIVVSGLRQQGIPVLDLREKLTDGSVDMDADDVFFNTDLHMRTDAELWAAREITSYLEQNCGIVFPDTGWLYDMDRYEKRSEPFVGNYCRDLGTVYENTDTFDLYIPKEETDMELYSPATGELWEGSFEDVCLMGMQNAKTDRYTYWVVNYLRYTYPYYIIKNKNIDGPDILILSDSIGYRTIAYMALTSGSITVLDPRFYNGTDYTTQALEEEYDVIIIYEQSFLVDFPIFPKEQ